MASFPDPLLIDVPSRSPVLPTAPVDRPMQTPTRTFHLESRGGYARSVVGKVAYLDTEARTYMVITGDGALTRVPLREIREPAARSEGRR